jgi:hypothetical protein
MFGQSQRGIFSKIYFGFASFRKLACVSEGNQKGSKLFDLQGQDLPK